MSDYYLNLVEGGTRTVQLSRDEEAAVLRAYDHGLTQLSAAERENLDHVIAKLKDEIHP